MRTVITVAALAIVAASGCGKHRKAVTAPAPPPTYPGSYAQSCRNISALDGGYIKADCADTSGHFLLTYLQASLCQGDIGNSNGVLACNGAVASLTPPGSPPASSELPASSLRGNN
jgi:hypothetical protein